MFHYFNICTNVSSIFFYIIIFLCYIKASDLSFEFTAQKKFWSLPFLSDLNSIHTKGFKIKQGF